jgi:hypothetical protein
MDRLNLTCANRVFIVELQWNPSVESQAIARAIRLGQDQQVSVIRYIVNNTVEQVSNTTPQFTERFIFAMNQYLLQIVRICNPSKHGSF